ncbi:MAG: hypothetical protein ACYDGR_15050 [Candidatus Dormibacteria bacterium]
MLSLLASTLVAATASEAPAVTLGASNTLTGDSTGFLNVRIPRATRLITSGGDKAPKVTGNGRWLGFALRGQDRSLIAWRSNLCWASGCSPPYSDECCIDFYADPFGSDHIIAPGTSAVDLSAGDYQLYLMADGAPVTVSLPLAGLTGSTHLHPRRTTRLDLRTITPTLEEGIPPAGLAYSGGGTGDLLTDWGFAFGLIALHPTSASNGTVGNCLIQGDAPGQVYTPGCPVSTTPNLITAYQPTGEVYYTTALSSLISTSRAGRRWSQGAWAAGYNAGSHPFMGQIAVWMDFLPLGTSDGAPSEQPPVSVGPVPGALGLPNSATGSGPGLGSLGFSFLVSVVALAARAWRRRVARGLELVDRQANSLTV